MYLMDIVFRFYAPTVQRYFGNTMEMISILMLAFIGVDENAHKTSQSYERRNVRLRLSIYNLCCDIRFSLSLFQS